MVLASFTSQNELRNPTLTRVKGYGGVSFKLQDLHQGGEGFRVPETSFKYSARPVRTCLPIFEERDNVHVTL